MTDTSNDLPRDVGPDAGRSVAIHAQALPAQRYPAWQTETQNPLFGDREDFRQTLFEYLRILLKRRWLIAGIALAFVSIGALRTLMQTPLYTAAARIQIDRDVAHVVKGSDVSPVETDSTEFLRTQYELLQGRTMAERVAASLHLGEDVDFFKPREFSMLDWIQQLLRPAPASNGSTASKAAKESWAAGIVLGNRAVRPVPGSRLVDITYSDPSPSRAQQVANAYAEAFIAANLDKRFEANAYAKTFLDDQIKQLKLKLEDSEKALLDFAEQEQIVQVTEKSSIAESNLASANAALGNLISERIRAEQLWHQVEKATGIDLPQLLTNTVIDGLRGRRNALVTEYQEKLETFKPSYPAMVQIDQKIKEIDRQLASEVKTIKASLKAAYESAKSQEDEIKARIEQLKTETLELQKRMIRYNILKREVDTNRDLYNGLLQRFKEVDVAGGVGANNVFIVDKAVMPGSPSSPQFTRAIMFALMLGLGAGLGAALLLERLDDRIHSAEEVERVTGFATLGIIPKIDPNSSVEVEIADPRSALAEAYRSLCTTLQFSTEKGLPKTLVVTSASQGEGKSITALGIARHFATVGLKVLLVDADMRLPSMHTKLGLQNSVGLSNYLTGSCSPPEAMQQTSVTNLAFMSSGPLPPNAADLLTGTRMHSLLSVGLEVFDLIVIDSPPLLGLADAQLLSSAAQATIFVVGAAQARLSLVRGALRRLHLARSPVIGVVLTKFDAKSPGYGYGYGHDYGYGYGHNPFHYGSQIAEAKSGDAQITSASERR